MKKPRIMELIGRIESTKDSIGRIKYSKLNIREDILPFYMNGASLNDKDLIDSFYRGYREVKKCKNQDCLKFQKWNKNKKEFSSYCSIKCSNSDPQKDKITVNNNMVKYGVPRASMTEESKAKLKETNLERFGCVSSAQHQSVKDKAKETNLKRYGHVSNTIGNIANLVESKGNTGIERKIEIFLNENNIKFVSKFRDGLELDFFLPDYGIGIECDGLYYHSYGTFSFGKDKKYFKDKHFFKQKLFKEKNIDVIFIWENEINDPIKFGIWCSMLKHKIIKTSTKFFARKTKIGSVPNTIRKDFLKENHIQGDTISRYTYGLYYEEELVALMSFAKSDKNLKYEFELKRFCVKKGYSIIGGASKLLKHFEKTIKPKSLITYLNKRWSFENNFYGTLGFKYSNFSAPAKFIISGNKVYNRLRFQKHKLNTIPNFVFDETITADQNILNNGYRLIWDCGNEVYIKEYI